LNLLLSKRTMTGSEREMSSNGNNQEPPGERLERLAVELRDLRRAVYALLELLAWAVLAAPFAVGLVVLRLPEGFVWPRLFDTSHAFVSGGVALVALRLSRRLFRPVVRRPVVHYAIALSFAAVVGLALELAQILGPGDPSVLDFMRDIAGASAGLAIALSCDSAFVRTRQPAARRGLRLMAVAALCVVAYPLVRIVWLIDEREAAFPSLAEFESRQEAPFVYAGNGAELALVPPPPGFTHARGQHVGRVTFVRGESPKLEVSGLFGDWSHAGCLAFDVFSPSASPVRLFVRIDDQHNDGGESDRFNTTLTIRPGQSTQHVAVEAIRRGPSGRQMDLARMQAVLFFLWEPAETVVLSFDNIRLASGSECGSPTATSR
jgi:hypothetical protein